ncbi:hypothetical protein QAD02_023964 [Eretmocerus hayati]|uniref:Uncharacterized protein n=1 Tax=Eretmocerus hayati TaxID=131215 RepID=A0ACC2PY18_9HYME|nr:hypothetical protein QAD02_023964 [Eretmocerus hayati]
MQQNEDERDHQTRTIRTGTNIDTREEIAKIRYPDLENLRYQADNNCPDLENPFWEDIKNFSCKRSFEGWLLELSSQSASTSALPPGQTPLDSLGAPGIGMASRVPKCSLPLDALVVSRPGPSKYTPASYIFLYPPGGALRWP